jgi:hypothetical protein
MPHPAQTLALAALALLVAPPPAIAQPAEQSVHGSVGDAGLDGAAEGAGQATQDAAGDALQVDSTMLASVPATPDEVQLDEVVIGTGQKATPVPAVVETTTAQDIERLNTVSSADAFKYVPNPSGLKAWAGVSYYDTMKDLTRVSARGQTIPPRAALARQPRKSAGCSSLGATTPVTRTTPSKTPTRAAAMAQSIATWCSMPACRSGSIAP